MLGIIHST